MIMYTFVYEISNGKKVYLHDTKREHADNRIQVHIPFGHTSKFIKKIK